MIFTLKVLCFILGFCVCVQVVGALFSVVDFWSHLRRYWPLVARAIVVWCGLALILALLLGETYRPAFVSGLRGYVGFFVASYFFSRLLIIRNRRIINKEQWVARGKLSSTK
jgi:hypothetical protein